MITLPDRQSLVRELVKPGSIGAEIGVYRGDFSKDIYAICDPKMIYLIDAWEKYPEYENDSLCHTNQDGNYNDTKSQMAHAIKAGRCEVIRGRSHPVSLTWHTPLDWIFLDANHAYEFVADDLRDWSRFIKPDGVFMLHDFTETSAGAIQMNFGVVRAVNEFCENNNWAITHITQEPDWPSCAIKRNT